MTGQQHTGSLVGIRAHTQTAVGRLTPRLQRSSPRMGLIKVYKDGLISGTAMVSYCIVWDIQ